jgi:type II secretory pathway pseudopilin PulG
MIVLGLVILIASAATPSIVRIIDQNASAQAFNLMAAQLRAARAIALLNHSYAAVHHQMADYEVEGNEGLKNRFYLAIVEGSEGGMAPDELLAIDCAGASSWVTSTASDDAGGQQIDNGGDTSKTLAVSMPLDAKEGDDGPVPNQVWMRWGRWDTEDTPETTPTSKLKVTITHAPIATRDKDKETTTIIVDQKLYSRAWYSLGVYPFAAGGATLKVDTSDCDDGMAVLGKFKWGRGGGFSFGSGGGQVPQRVPGSMAFGEMTDGDGISPGTYNSTNESFDNRVYQAYTEVLENTDTRDHPHAYFTTFSLVFSPNGSLTALPNGDVVVMSDTGGASVQTLFLGSRRLWNVSVANADGGKPGASVVTLFDYAQFSSAGTEGIAFLNRTARILPVNVHTADLLGGE